MAVILRRSEAVKVTGRRVGYQRFPTCALDFWAEWVVPAKWHILGALFIAGIGLLGFQFLANIGEYVSQRMGSPCACLRSGERNQQLEVSSVSHLSTKLRG